MLASKFASTIVLGGIVVSGSTSGQSTALVSRATTGVQGDAASHDGVISGDSRVVAFVSDATTLVPSDTNGVGDVFAVDRAVNQTTRVSVSSTGVQANNSSGGPSVSTDGRFVAFHTQASNLFPGDTNGALDVALHDRASGSTQCVSVSLSGASGNGPSSWPSLSSDGRFVAFLSDASNLVLGDTNATGDVFVWDRASGGVERVSMGSSGTEANDHCYAPSISGDGRFIAFFSGASNLVAGDSNAAFDVFVRDRTSAQTVRVSVDSSGAQGNLASLNAAISSDGKLVTFESAATNLVPGDTNGAVVDVFVRDLQSSTTERVSVDNAGVQANAGGGQAAISSDGRFIAFYSSSPNLVGGDTNGQPDIFVRDRMLSKTRRVSLGNGGNQSNDACYLPSISADGRWIAFYSWSDSLVDPDVNGMADVFVRDWFKTCFIDADTDGYGDPNQLTPLPLLVCPTGYSINNLDCNDANGAISPGAPEICDGYDNNCNGLINENFVSNYCTAGTTVHGCVPHIAGQGAASATAVSGFDIVVHGIEGQRYGTIFYGFYPVATPWALGSPSFKCVANPVTRTGVLDSGGAAGQCNGELRLDFNAWMRANPAALGSPFVAGQVFYAQGWFRDPAAPKQTNLSNGLRFTLCD